MKSFIIFLTCLAAVAAYSVNLTSRIVGGRNAIPNQFPFMVLIKLLRKNDVFYLTCGGSLISHEWVISAGHCIYETQHIFVYLGDIRALKGRSYKVEPKDYVIHEHFQEHPFLNDICLIKIPYMIYTPSVMYTELPYQFQDETFIGVKATTMGWGLTKNNGQLAGHLKYLELIVTRPQDCKNPDVVISENILCVAVKKPQSPCNGDSGGPLIYDTSDGPVIIGIISTLTGLNCELGYPIVYTRVSEYIPWIGRKTGIEYISNNLNENSTRLRLNQQRNINTDINTNKL